MKDINQNDCGSGEYADTPTSAPGTKRSSRLSWFRDSRMSSNGRTSPYPGAPECWISRYRERQVSGRNRNYKKSVYKVSLTVGSQP
jgi:hypothetical protein